MGPDATIDQSIITKSVRFVLCSPDHGLGRVAAVVAGEGVDALEAAVAEDELLGHLAEGDAPEGLRLEEGEEGEAEEHLRWVDCVRLR